jgi:putative transposase
MCRRASHAVKNWKAYIVMGDHRLLQKPRERAAEVYQTARHFELLPQRPNDLWQMDVTYIHIPGHRWWYAATVIDYYSRYLLACHLTFSYSATEVMFALKLAREEAERIGGPLAKRPFLVTDNGRRSLLESLRSSCASHTVTCEFSTGRPSSWGSWSGFIKP